MTSPGFSVRAAVGLRPRAVTEKGRPGASGIVSPVAGIKHEIGLLARSGSLALIGQITSAVLAFAFALAVGHLFHAVATGAFFIAVALFTVCSFIATLGADSGLTRSLPHLTVHGRTRDIYRVLIIAVIPPVLVSAGMAVLLWGYAPQLAHVVTNAPAHGAVHADGTQTFTTYLRQLVPFLPLATLTAVLVAGARGLDSMWPAVAVQNTVVPSARVVLLFGLVAAGAGATAVGVAWSLPLVFGAIGCIMALRTLSARRRSAFDAATAHEQRSWRSLSGEFWGYAAPRGAGAAFSLIVLWLDVVLVGALASTRQAGIYAVASRCVILATFPMVALGFAIAPQISRLFSRGLLRQAGDIYKAGTAWLVALAWPACLFMAIFSPVIMRLFGREFVAGATTLSILSVAMLVNTGCGSCGVVLSMTGRTVANLTIAFLAAAVDVGGNFLLVPHWGMRGAAIAWAAAMVIANGGTLIVLFKQFGLHPFGRATVRVGLFAILCFGVVGAVVRVGLGPTFTGAYLTGAVGTAAYCALLWRWRQELGLSSGKALIAPVVSTSGEDSGAGEAPQYAPDDRLPA
jgi:O-antigen/teichoic acid export membrane protein